MKLSELFELLQYGELANLPVSGGIDDVKGIRVQDYPVLISHINLALTDLHTKFNLKEREVAVQQYEAITQYQLDAKFAVTNTGSTEPVKYILDSESNPFTDDILRINSIFDEAGCELPINNENQTTSLFLNGYKTLQVPFPADDNTIFVMYRANHTKLVSSIPDLDAEVEIPAFCVEAVLSYVASRVHSQRTSQEAQINAVNLIDGVDGLSAGTSLLSIGLLTKLMGGGEHYFSLAFIGLGLIVFMGFNYSEKRKIFLGDAGSLGLRFVLATLAMEFLHSGNNHIENLNLNPLIVAILILGYPIADTMRVFTIRMSLGLSPFNADKRHMHHVLLDKGFSHFGVTSFIMTVIGGFVVVNKFLAPRLDSHLMILLNVGALILIHLFVRYRSTQLRTFWRSFSRTVFNCEESVEQIHCKLD